MLVAPYLQMLGSIDNVVKGRIRAEFYVDQWPHFNALVCQYLAPKKSDVSFLECIVFLSNIIEN